MSLTALAFLGAYAFGLARTFVSHPKWGLITYLAVFYLHPPMRWWGESLPSSFRWALIAAVATLFAMPQAKLRQDFAPWQSLPVTKVMMTYVAWMWIQLAWANPLHFEDLILVTKYALLFFLFYRIANTEKILCDIALVHMMGCFYFGWLAFDADGVGRLEFIGGPGVYDSNTLGMHMSTSLFFAATLIFTQKGWRRWATVATIPFIVNCIVQTESRGAFLGAVVGSLFYYYYSPRTYRRRLVPLAVIGLCGLLAYAPATYWERLGTMGAVSDEEKEVDNSALSRVYIMKAQLEMLKDYPLGLGSRTTTYLSRSYLETRWLTALPGQDLETQGVRASHATLMSVVTDQGIPGIIIVIIGGFTISRMFAQMGQLSRNNRNGTITLLGASASASLMTVFISGLFTDYLRAEIQVWCLAILAVVLQIDRSAARAESANALPPEQVRGLNAHHNGGAAQSAG